MAGYYSTTLAVCVSIRLPYARPSVFLFPDDDLSKCQWTFSPNLVCVFILWRSGLGLLMGKFLQFLTELSARNRSVVSFRILTLVNINGFAPNLVCALIL